MAKYCSSCGKEIAEGTKFCSSCGKPAVSEVVPIMSEKEDKAYAEFGKGISFVVVLVLVIAIIVLIVKVINHPYWSI